MHLDISDTLHCCSQNRNQYKHYTTNISFCVLADGSLYATAAKFEGEQVTIGQSVKLELNDGATKPIGSILDDVDNLINNALDGYKTQVEDLINNALNGYITRDDVEDLIEDALNNAGGGNTGGDNTGGDDIGGDDDGGGNDINGDVEATYQLIYELTEDSEYYIVTGVEGNDYISIVIPSSSDGIPVRAIAADAFGAEKPGMSSIMSIVIEGDIDWIGARAFRGCESLELIDFSHCSKVPEVEETTSPELFALDYECKTNWTIRIPNDLSDAWREDPTWAHYSDAFYEV